MRVKEPSALAVTVAPWMVLPSHAVGCVGMTPFGAAHSTTWIAVLLSGAAKAEFAGMTMF